MKDKLNPRENKKDKIFKITKMLPKKILKCQYCLKEMNTSRNLYRHKKDCRKRNMKSRTKRKLGNFN